MGIYGRNLRKKQDQRQSGEAIIRSRLETGPKKYNLFDYTSYFQPPVLIIDVMYCCYVVLALQSPVVTVRTGRFNIQQFYVLPTQCIYVFCVDLRTNSDYFPVQH
jgi:hypothetical protein